MRTNHLLDFLRNVSRNSIESIVWIDRNEMLLLVYSQHDFLTYPVTLILAAVEVVGRKHHYKDRCLTDGFFDIVTKDTVRQFLIVQENYVSPLL